MASTKVARSAGFSARRAPPPNTIGCRAPASAEAIISRVTSSTPGLLLGRLLVGNSTSDSST